MPFQPIHLAFWRRGSVLVGEPDSVPDDALRRAVNVRLDRTRGTISSRPGWARLTTSAIASGVVSWLSKLYAASDFSYAQIGSTLYRLTDAWGSAASLGSVGSGVLSDANLSDGNGNLFKYLVNGSTAKKDDGSSLTTMGIAAPTAAPASASLATDLSTAINAMDDHTQWTGTNIGGKADETNIKQEGTGSVTFTVAASTLGSIADGLTTLNLDTLTGGDDSVKDDDYIHVWIRIDRPDFVDYVQLDFDLDTNVVANAFRDNFYSVRLPSLTVLNQGRDQWTKIQVRKSQFARFGTSASKSWATVEAARISVLTNSLGSITAYVDDLKLRGGVDVEGDIEYTAVYRNSTTDGRGNPPKNSDGAVLFTTKLTVNRQRVSLDISNVVSGGANHPGDAQIDKIMIFRRGGSFTNATLTETIDDTTASPHIDDVSDNTILLVDAVTELETDNDLPPAGTTRVLFGPDAQGILFMIIDGKRIHFSKAFEDGENRAENWGSLNFFLAGDGAQAAVAGITRDTERFFWTERSTYQIVGVGVDTFLPVEIPGSRGAVGQHAVTSGDGRIFFRAPDGIYEQRGLQQIKLTGAIDPFFNGQTIDGQAHETDTAAARAQVRLEYHSDPNGSMVTMLYCENPSGTPNRSLVLKPNSENGLHTEVFFDSSSVTNLRSLMVDDEDRELLAGGEDGHIYRIEDHASNSDSGVAIALTARTKSHDGGVPQHSKHVYQVALEGNTSGTVVDATAYYDRASSTESLGSRSSTGPADEMYFQAADPTARRHDVAIEVTGSGTDRVTLSRVGLHMAALPERMTAMDSDDLTFEDMHALKLLRIDLEASANITVKVHIDGVVRDTRTLIVPATREVLEHHLPPGLKGKAFRINLMSTASFQMYSITGHLKPLGTARGYRSVAMARG